MLTCDVLASIRKKQKIALAVIMSCLRQKASNMHPNMAANIKSLRNKHNHVETHHRDLLLCHKLRSSADDLFFGSNSLLSPAAGKVFSRVQHCATANFVGYCTLLRKMRQIVKTISWK